VSVRPLPSADRPGVLARPIARSLALVDTWDVWLAIGYVLLVCGVSLILGALVGLSVGIGSGMTVGGALLMVGALRGASAQSLSERGG